MNSINPDPSNVVLHSKTLQTRCIRIEEKNGPENYYDKIKVFAVYQLLVELLRQIELKLFDLESHSPLSIAIHRMPHNAFMWTKEAWLERLLYGRDWVNTLLNVRNKSWLEQRKRHVDLRQLEGITSQLLSSYIGNESAYNSFTILQSIMKYNKIEETLTKQLQSNNNIMKRLKKEKDVFDKMATSILKIKQSFISKTLEQCVLNRTKQRYTKNYNNTAEEQAQIEVDLRITNMLKELERYEIHKRNDVYISACKLDVYFNNMQKIRMKIKDLGEWYANKEDKANEKRQILSSDIGKCRTDLEVMKNRLVLYKKAIELHRTNSNISIRDLLEIDKQLFPKRYKIEDKSLSTSMITLFELRGKALNAVSVHNLRPASSTQIV